MTPRQRKCFDILMYHFDKALDELMTFQGDLEQWLDQLDKKLDQTSTVVDTVAAGATLGVLLVPLTGGTSLAVTAACGTIAAGITIGKALNGCVRALSRASDGTPVSPQCESALAAFKTSTRAGLTMVAHAITVYYSHIINEVMEECSLPTFASYGASRVLKRLKAELKQQLKTYQDPATAMKVMLVPEVFIDYLLQSVTLSQRSEKIMLNPRYCPTNWMGSREMPVKWAFSRSRLVLPVKPASPIALPAFEFGFYASENEGHFLSDGTLECYGYVMLQLFCDRSHILQINHRRYQALQIKSADEQEARKHLSLYFSVSRQDIMTYLMENRRAPLSLNQYLTRCYGVNIVAVIHENILSDLDLSLGDFSDVVGINNVIIEHSNLKGTRWNGAFLPHSIIRNVETDEHTSFSDAFLEFSEFEHVVFTGDWSNTRINFSMLTDCKISTRMLDKTTNWSWVRKHNVVMDDEREEILAASTAVARDIVDSKIEESESKLQEQLERKFREIEASVIAVRELEKNREDELIRCRDDQKII